MRLRTFLHWQTYIAQPKILLNHIKYSNCVNIFTIWKWVKKNNTTHRVGMIKHSVALELCDYHLLRRMCVFLYVFLCFKCFVNGKKHIFKTATGYKMENQYFGSHKKYERNWPNKRNESS